MSRGTMADLAPPAPGAGDAVDVVVLAGGTGRRLGGACKPQVVARGARLLDHVLTGLLRVRPGLGPGRVVVVAPPEVPLPAGVLRALEDPPLGGPVAGLGAGLLALAGSAAPLTAVLACDAPGSWQLLPALAAQARRRPGGDGAVAADGEHVQYLLGVYRTRALAARVAPGGVPVRDVSVRRTLEPLHVDRVELGTARTAARDLDTWQDVHEWESRPGT